MMISSGHRLKVKVQVLELKGIQGTSGSPNTFVKVKCMDWSATTRIIKEESNPKFREMFEVMTATGMEAIVLELNEKPNIMRSPIKLGYTVIMFDTIKEKAKQDVWLPVEGQSETCSIHVNITPCFPTKDLELAQPYSLPIPRGYKLSADQTEIIPDPWGAFNEFFWKIKYFSTHALA
eukprot:TRINITY_DN15847_c0_g1_i1.p1 TRINITY_DN15847_c0_g1~~TRINITY_DN15847_c0_g1_i1.p1  ORF type:complete len:178 (-),score=27.23 TRINITY_DN15847_c0_g1_i1:43-576(-)